MTLDNSIDLWLILMVVLPITLGLIWLELQRKHKFKRWRIIAVIIMMIALAGIFLKPAFETTKSSSITLLTPGFQPTKVDSLLRTHPSMAVMHFENTSQFKNSKLLSYYELMDRGKEIEFIVGQGLPGHALDLWDDKNYKFIPAGLREGITSLKIPSPVHINRKNTLSGTLESRTDNVWLYLETPGGKEDSFRISKGKNQFELSFTPRTTGHFLYKLSTTNASSNINEVIPVRVEEENQVRILFLQHHPAFETQQLKQFLGRKKHVVTVRNQVSKTNFRYEYINRTPIQVNRLSNAILENFDIVIADEESLQTFSPAERETLVQSIQSGLGLLNISSNTTRKKSSLFPFDITSFKTDTAHIPIGNRWFTLPSTAMSVRENPELFSIHKNKNRILAGYTFVGVGKIGFQLLQETYRLALAGDTTAYGSFWTPVLENVTRIKSADSKIRINSSFPLVEHEPINIELISSAESVSLFNDSIQVSLQEDPNIDNVFHTRIWPVSSGWHRLTTDSGTLLSYYVSKKNSWMSLSVANQLKLTKQSANSQAVARAPVKARKQIPMTVWYLLFLLSAGFLWLAPKL